MLNLIGSMCQVEWRRRKHNLLNFSRTFSINYRNYKSTMPKPPKEVAIRPKLYYPQNRKGTVIAKRHLLTSIPTLNKKLHEASCILVLNDLIFIKKYSRCEIDMSNIFKRFAKKISKGSRKKNLFLVSWPLTGGGGKGLATKRKELSWNVFATNGK